MSKRNYQQFFPETPEEVRTGGWQERKTWADLNPVIQNAGNRSLQIRFVDEKSLTEILAELADNFNAIVTAFSVRSDPALLGSEEKDYCFFPGRAIVCISGHHSPQGPVKV